jgi:dTDP-4-dehydrorhamnose 3,5-epimerase
MIDGGTITPFKQFFDERGKVMHMLRCYSDTFQKFGEISTLPKNRINFER